MGLADVVGVSLMVGVTVAVGVVLVVVLALALVLGLTLGLGLTLAVTLTVADSLMVGLGDPVTDADSEIVGVTLGLGLGVALRLVLVVALGEGVGDGSGVALGEGPTTITMSPSFVAAAGSVKRRPDRRPASRLTGAGAYISVRVYAGMRRPQDPSLGPWTTRAVASMATVKTQEGSEVGVPWMATLVLNPPSVTTDTTTAVSRYTSPVNTKSTGTSGVATFTGKVSGTSGVPTSTATSVPAGEGRGEGLALLLKDPERDTVDVVDTVRVGDTEEVSERLRVGVALGVWDATGDRVAVAEPSGTSSSVAPGSPPGSTVA